MFRVQKNRLKQNLLTTKSKLVKLRLHENISFKAANVLFLKVFSDCLNMFGCFVGLFGSFVFLQVLWLTICTALVGYSTEGLFKQWLNRKVSIMCFGVLSSAISSLITYHNPENRPKNGICVANHTSPIDVLVLMCDNCYSLVCD